MGEIISGIGSYIGGNKAAAASEDAARAQQIMFQQTQATLEPYFDPGAKAFGNALTLAQGGTPDGQPNYLNMAGALFPGGLPGSGGPGVPGGGMSQAELEATPGYQFTLGQGLKATQSAAAARGLGMSGASMKGAATYATGLADSTYTNQFNISQQKFNDALNASTQQFNRYNSLATIGANAAAHTGTLGTLAAQNYGTDVANAGALQGAGIQGLAKGIGSGVNDALGIGLAQNLLMPQQGTSGYG